MAHSDNTILYSTLFSQSLCSTWPPAYRNNNKATSGPSRSFRGSRYFPNRDLIMAPVGLLARIKSLYTKQQGMWYYYSHKCQLTLSR